MLSGADKTLAAATLAFLLSSAALPAQNDRPRARDLGIHPGVYEPGEHNAITDVEGVLVGHRTIVRGDDVRTGVTAILPHGGNVFAEKVPAAAHVFNGFGKAVGFPQINELGVIETPILLTNTLAVWRAADALKRYVLNQPGNEQVRSVNVVVAETNDGRLNDIRGDHVSARDVLAALDDAASGSVAEGSVGAGTGTVCFGWKGGIGTSSRVLPDGVTVGVLVQSNFGGRLTIDGAPVWKSLQPPARDAQDGSLVMIVATDAAVDARQLGRIARRAPLGMARTGSSGSHGSGDFVLAFSANRAPAATLADSALSPIFQAVIEATEEAILNSLLRATTVRGRNGAEAEAIPIARLQRLLDRRAEP